MKKKLTPRRLIIMLTGVLFAAYSAYNVFIIFRDGRVMSAEGVFISALVALLFLMLTAFAWTSDVKNIRFLSIRIPAFIIILLALFALKLRMAGSVIEYVDFAKTHTILYGGAYLLTQAALLILIIYYAFILKDLPLYPRASVILPATAMILFLSSFVLEIILFFVYGIGSEASPLRTVVIRPIFYLGFIGLSLYFLIPRKPKNSDEYRETDEIELVIPDNPD